MDGSRGSVDELPDVDRLAEVVQALSSPPRLHLLRELRAPKKPSQLRVPADQDREGLRSDRMLSRPAISQHIAELRDLGLVEKTEDGAYVVNHQRLFSALREVSRLAVIRPEVEVDVEETLRTESRQAPGSASGPRLVVVGGPREGRVFLLEGAGPWLVGRGPQADIRLDYDPHVSREHLQVHERSDGTFAVEANPDATNATLVDFVPIEGDAAALVAGSVLAVGSSRLVLRIA
jgi:DNA-binding transcriptional ArsR family regulator